MLPEEDLFITQKDIGEGEFNTEFFINGKISKEHHYLHILNSMDKAGYTVFKLNKSDLVSFKGENTSFEQIANNLKQIPEFNDIMTSRKELNDQNKS